MSNTVPQEVIAFHNILDNYYSAMSNSGSNIPFFGKLSGRGRPVVGKVRVSTSDFVADVELAANRALIDFPPERRVFKRIYLDADDDFKAIFARRLGEEQFKVMDEEIQRRVGAEFIKSSIYPLRQYTAVEDVR